MGASPGVKFKLGFTRFLLNTLGIICVRRQQTIVRQVRRVLLALNIKHFETVNRKLVGQLVKPKMDSIFFTSIIQYNEVSARHPLFRTLKAQSVIKQLHSYTKFLHFCERYKFLEPGERKVLNTAISHWRKYLLNYLTAPPTNPILDITILKLNDTYTGYINKLQNEPEFIVNSKVAIKMRDAVISLLCSRFGKRPTEISTLSVWNVLHPKKFEATYRLDCVPYHPSKTSAKFGQFQLFVSSKIFKILQLYVRFVRPLLSRGESISEKSYLWVTSTGRPCNGKVISDIITRCLEQGNSGVRIGSRSLRICLATLAAVYTKNNVSRNGVWKHLNTGIARSMRHSEKIHTEVYVKQSEGLYLSRCDSLTESIMTGDLPTDQDVAKLTDTSLNKAIMPSHLSVPVSDHNIPTDNVQFDHSVPIVDNNDKQPHYHPKERVIPRGNLSTYHYLDILYDHTFSIDTHISAADLRKRLAENPAIAKKLMSNLRLQNLKKITKISGRAHTYKNYLIRNGIKI